MTVMFNGAKQLKLYLVQELKDQVELLVCVDNIKQLGGQSLYQFHSMKHHCATTNRRIEMKPEKERFVSNFVHNWIINSVLEKLQNCTDLLLNTSNTTVHSWPYSNDLVP